MGSIYRRGNKLWLRYRDGAKRWRSAASGFDVGQEAEARKVLARVEERLEVGFDITEGETGTPTLGQYAKRWVQEREAQGLPMAQENEQHLRLHILAVLGAMTIADIRPRHVRSFVQTLKAKPDFAPRTVRNI